jgi:hypothetical protein
MPYPSPEQLPWLFRTTREECSRLAEKVKTDGHRKILEEMAEAWRHCSGRTYLGFLVPGVVTTPIGVLAWRNGLLV